MIEEEAHFFVDVDGYVKTSGNSDDIFLIFQIFSEIDPQEVR